MEKSTQAASNLLGQLEIDYKLDYSPKRVVSILSSSRSGSTIFKYALCLHPDLTSLAGEEEPYYKIACNGYPWHKSDEFHQVDNPDIVRLLISNEVHNYQQLVNRQYLQYNQIEEPPYVRHITCRQTDTLVLKTPNNAYRAGVIEQLYPDAEIIYVRLNRQREGAVNGLLDGWLSPDFTARKTPLGWWKFDMPPNWSWQTLLVGRCLNQYNQSQRYITEDYRINYTETYEMFCEDWQQSVKSLWDHLGLPIVGLPDQLPVMVATNKPDPYRWEKKRPWLYEELECLRQVHAVSTGDR